MVSIPDIPAYNSTRFVDRNEELDQVASLVQAKQGGKATDTRALVVRCERGSGKTWFSLHLKRSVLSTYQNVKTLLICLAQPAGISGPMADEWVPPTPQVQQDQLTDLVTWVTTMLEIKWGEKPNLAELKNWMANIDKSQLLVVILDSVFDADHSAQEWLEDNLLRPLLEAERTLLVLTGRGTPFTWTSEDLGPNAKALDLKPFPRNFAQEQLEKLRETIKMHEDRYQPDEIWAISNGYPIVIALLAKGDELEVVVEELLDDLVNLDQRNMLEALCPLQKFGETEIAPMMKARGVLPEAWTLQDIRKNVRDSLIASSLMKRQGGYFYLDENVRHVLCEYLKRCKRECWLDLNQAAHDLYAGQARDPKYRAQHAYFADLAEIYQKEIAALADSDADVSGEG
jgi:hypothetical protein